MKNMSKKVLAAVLILAMAISMGSILAGAVADPVNAYRTYKNNNTTPKADHTIVYAKTSKTMGEWNWQWPVPKLKTIRSCYADFPGRTTGHHDGIDIPCGPNTSVQASYPGIVIKSVDSNSGYGKHVIIEHFYNGKTYKSIYAHLSSRTAKEEGVTVRAGDEIGKSGDTGTPGQYHLHFSIWEGIADSPKSSKTCIDPFLNHFVAVPEEINCNAPSTEGGKCCHLYLDAIKLERNSRELKITHVNSTSLKLEWDAVSGANGYDVWLDGKTLTGANQITRLTSTSAIVLGLKAGTRYYIRVQGMTAAGREAGISKGAYYTIPAPVAVATITYKARTTASLSVCSNSYSITDKNKALTTIPNNVEITVVAECNGYGKTTYNSKTGWVSLQYITKGAVAPTVPTTTAPTTTTTTTKPATTTAAPTTTKPAATTTKAPVYKYRYIRYESGAGRYSPVPFAGWKFNETVWLDTPKKVIGQSSEIDSKTGKPYPIYDGYWYIEQTMRVN